MCNQCGKCCWQLAYKKAWENADLTEQEIELLMSNRQPHKGCEMVQPEGDHFVCLIHKHLGYDRKPTSCKEWHCDN